jgi:hypothetical protein
VTEFRLLIFTIVLVIFPAAKAHRLDDLMQASFIEIKPNGIRIQLNLNPGVAVADKVTWIMDRDGDGAISGTEEMEFSKVVKKQLKLSIDSQTLPLEILNTEFDDAAELRRGNGNIRIELAAHFPHLLPGAQSLRFENGNWPKMSVYLVNAILPRDSAIKVLRQVRNETQSIGWIAFSAEPSPPSNRHWNASFLMAALLAAISGLFFCLVRCRDIRIPHLINGGRLGRLHCLRRS